MSSSRGPPLILGMLAARDGEAHPCDWRRGAAGYHLVDSKGRQWVWLTVKSRSPGAKQLPLFFDRDVITGTVEVDFDRADAAKGVSITATAGDLWDAKASSSASASSGKPKGRQLWPFSVTLPNEVSIAEKSKGKQQPQPQIYPLPPTFSERASPAYIDYKLVVTVRKGAFKVNQTLATSFVYLPLTRADPPSRLRQVSYREGSMIIGPSGDPDGWKVLSPIRIVGTLFNTRPVELQCTVAISKPLTYATGAPLPLFLTLTGTDAQALDLLSTPSAVNLHLIRSRAVGTQAAQDEATARSDSVFRESVGSAFWWPSEEGAPEALRRTLQGELDVKKGLKPSFVFPKFSLRYMLVLLPFQAPGFSSASSASEPLLTEKIMITSVNAPGVVPRSYAPPGYVHPEEGDYNTAVGYLENGNQRFLHHGGFQ
ncbi:hypothetical protein A0H81_15025 [Grifola frondosa]|uniref:Arrestin-like N-terminal domain-containing protein n=1 Tax=Grifola frondosa TaxID=5627 RepID=A0A1C7LK67_GRIFR|nr:hypothetical protein A0H81_15025 [Grifola frondosa]